MEVKESVTLRGSRESVLRDAASLHEFLKTLSTAVSDTAAEEPQVDSPHYENRLLTFRGKTATITERQELILIPLLEARGRVVPRQELARPFNEAGLNPNEMNVNMSRLRQNLSTSVPAIVIETAGSGYKLAVK